MSTVVEPNTAERMYCSGCGYALVQTWPHNRWVHVTWRKAGDRYIALLANVKVTRHTPEPITRAENEERKAAARAKWDADFDAMQARVMATPVGARPEPSEGFRRAMWQYEVGEPPLQADRGSR